MGAAESLFTLLSAENNDDELPGTEPLTPAEQIAVTATDLVILPRQGKTGGPLNFTLNAGQRIALVGQSGTGKSSLLNLLLGFLPYEGSIRINQQELRDISPKAGGHS